MIYQWSVPNIDADACFIKLKFPGDQHGHFDSNVDAFSISKTVGIGDLLDRGGLLSMFPNPVADKLSVSFTSQSEGRQTYAFEVYNTIGDVILNQTYVIDSPTQTININVGDWIPGMYFLKVSSNSHRVSKRFIKK